MVLLGKKLPAGHLAKYGLYFTVLTTKEEASMNKELFLWIGGAAVALGVIVVSWDWLATYKPAPPQEVSVGTDAAGQEAFGDSD